MNLPNEIIILILEKFIHYNSYDEYIKLKEVNEFYKYYCEKIMHIKAMKIAKKYMKRIKRDMLYNKHDTFNCIKALIMDSFKENKIFASTNTELTNKNIREIQLPSYLVEYEPTYDNRHECFVSNKITVFTYDVIQSIIIRGKNIRRVVIDLPFDMKLDYHYNNNDMITIFLSKNGLYSLLLSFTSGIRYIHVYADNCKKIYTYGKFFNKPDESQNNVFKALNEEPGKFSKFEKDLYRSYILD